MKHDNFPSVLDQIATESVSYIILDDPFLTFSTGALQTFALTASVRANYVAFPRTDDNFSRNLVEEQRDRIESKTDGIDTGNLITLLRGEGPVVSSTRMRSTAHMDLSKIERLHSNLLSMNDVRGWWRSIRGFYDNNKSWINPMATAAARVLMAEEKGEGDYVDVLKMKKSLHLVLAMLKPYKSSGVANSYEYLYDAHTKLLLAQEEFVLDTLVFPEPDESPQSTKKKK
jgi:hypothetical protein